MRRRSARTPSQRRSTGTLASTMGTTLRRRWLLGHPPACWTGKAAPSLRPPGRVPHLASHDRHLVEGTEHAAPSCSIVLGALTALRAGHCISPGSVFRRVSTRPLGPCLRLCHNAGGAVCIHPPRHLLHYAAWEISCSGTTCRAWTASCGTMLVWCRCSPSAVWPFGSCRQPHA